MPALVAIDVAVVDCQEQCDQPDVASLLAACNAALHEGACVDSASTVEPEYVARVRVESATSIVVEVRPARDVSARPVVRALSFSEADEPHEKWRTVGFTTALIIEGEVQPTAKSTPETVTYSGIVTARLVGAAGFQGRSPKAGARVHLDGRLWSAPILVGISAEYTTSGWATPSVTGNATWSEVGLDVSAVWAVADDLQLIPRLSAIAQRLAVTGEKKREVAEAHSWQAGLRAGLDLAWPLHPRWYGVIGGQVTGVTAPVEVVVEDKVLERVGTVSVGANVGIQYRF